MRFAFPAALLLLLAAACAQAPDDELPLEQQLASQPAEESIKIPDPPAPPADDAGPGTDDDASTAPPPPPPPATAGCTAPSPCSGATVLLAVSGDTGADVRTASAATSQWFKVKVEENDDSIDGVELWMRATLVSPPGTNYDLYVYTSGSCGSAASGQSVQTSSNDLVSSQFGESGLFSNGSSDSRDVLVEVRHVSGPCNASTPWQLTIAGNQ